MQKLNCFLPVLLSGILNTVAAQLPDFSFRHYTIENGFPASSILQVTQDKDGYIWSQNDYGLIRFDGNNFRSYRPDNADSFSLPPSKVYNFGKGSKDLLLVSYERGICYYDDKTTGFKKLVPENLLKTAPSTRPFASNNEIWFATQDKQLHRFDTKSGALTSFAACENYVACVFVDSRKRIWVGTHNGVYRFDPQKNKYELYWQDTTHTLYGAGMVRDIIEDEKNMLWFAGTNSGIYSLDPVNRSIKFFDFKPVHWRKAKFYLISYLSAHIINGAPYILANSNDGLVFLNRVTGKYSVIKHDPGNPRSILSNTVTEVIYDNAGTIWLATVQGLCKSEKMLPGLKTVRISLLKNENEDDEDYGSEIKIIRHDHRNNKLWIGTASHGLWQYDWGKDSVITRIPVLNGQHQPVEITELYIDKRSRLWLGTSAGAALYEPGTGRLEFLSQDNEDKDRFATNEVTSNFMEDGQDNVWVGTSNGVSIYNQNVQFVKNIIEGWDNPEKTKKHYIYALLPKNERQVWVVSRSLKLYDLDSRSFVSEISKNKSKITIPSFYEVTDDGRGNFYFTGFSGIYVWKKEGDSFYFPRFNSFTNKNFSESFVDNRNQLWIASFGEGLLKIDPGTNAIAQFTVKNGLGTNLINHLQWSQRQGPLYFIMRDGFQYFYPDSVRTDTQSVPLRITGINILEKPLKADYRSFADSSLRVSYKQNVISFEFSLLDYNFTEYISYQYKLDGFDKDWINAGNHRSATYTNLDAGHYIFRVRAKNHDGIDAGEAIIKFRVVPPFWKTGWFITLGILIVLLLLYRWYMHQQQKYRSEKILNSFTTSLYGQTTIEDMAWDIARNCVNILGFVDCIVYILDEEKGVLVQKAACGPKNPLQREILNPIEISLGKGIVGSVAQSGIAEIIHDTSVDQRYIVDDMRRFSEISVPMVTDRIVFGIIDSEHPEKNFFTRQHLYLLKKIADVCSLRISKYIMEDRLRTKIARDLHDEMGSTLTSINIISKVALQWARGNDFMQANLQKIKDHSGHMMESMSDMVWAINPANDTLEKIVMRMKEHAAEMLEPARINLYFSEDGTLDNIKLNIAQRKDLYLIFKEAINNAVKYSGATEIQIHLARENNNMEMQIVDNGKGFETEKIRSGNGVRNMHSRAAQMKALLEIQSSPGAGTTIRLQVPVT